MKSILRALALRLAGSADSSLFRASQRSFHRFNRTFAPLRYRFEQRAGERIVELEEKVFAIPHDMLWTIKGGSYYERSMSFWLTRFVRESPSAIFYDVGANFGYFTVTLADRVATVVSFEPVANVHRVLTENIARNDIQNATPVRAALGDKMGVAAMNLFTSSGNNSLVRRTIGPYSDAVRIGSEEVRTERLDDFIAREKLPGPPSVMKIDVEGAELAVLRGARLTLARWRPAVVVESSPEILLDAGHTVQDLVKELLGHGYTLRGLSVDDSDMRAHELRDLPSDRTATLLALSPDMASLFDTAAPEVTVGAYPGPRTAP